MGIAQAALDCAMDYASKRTAFGQSILKLQSIQNKIADIAMKVSASRLLTYHAAALKDAGRPFTKVNIIFHLFAFPLEFL